MSTPAKSLEYEKILYRYSSALQRGDFAAIAAVLELAQADPELERLLLELNQAYVSASASPPHPSATLAATRQATAGWQGRLRRFFRRLISLIPPDPPAIPSPARWALLGAGSVVLILVSVALIARLTQSQSGRGLIRGPLHALLTEAPVPTEAPAAIQAPAIAASQPTPLPSTGGAGSRLIQPYPLPEAVAPPGSQHLIVRDGSLTLVVSDTRKARDAIQSLVNAMSAQGAYVVSSNEMNSGDASQPAIQMVLRVPAARFEATMNSLAALAQQVYARDESAQDVTAEYVDLAAQLEQLQAARQRLLEIMKSASNTNDLLQAESLLTQRETEIASIQGRMKYLQETAQLSSIQVALNPSVLSQPIQPAGWNPAETVRLALGRLVGRFQAFSDWLINFSIATLPWLLVLGLLVLGVLRIAIRRKPG
jgi:Domain of unknown function (DUF4349)